MNNQGYARLKKAFGKEGTVTFIYYDTKGKEVTKKRHK
jgi:hypothetical protein